MSSHVDSTRVLGQTVSLDYTPEAWEAALEPYAAIRHVETVSASGRRLYTYAETVGEAERLLPVRSFGGRRPQPDHQPILLLTGTGVQWNLGVLVAVSRHQQPVGVRAQFEFEPAAVDGE